MHEDARGIVNALHAYAYGREEGTGHRVQCLIKRARRYAAAAAGSAWICVGMPRVMQKACRHKRMQMHESAKVKSLRHQVFPGGPPSKYSPGPTMLNFCDQTRTGVLIVVWS